MKKTAPLKSKPSPAAPEQKSGKKPPSKARSTRKTASSQVVGGGIPAASITTIAARADIGFGNVLFLRGGGPGLSWEFGLPMACQSDDLWTFDVLDAERPVAFKFLINDETWSAGPDYIVEPGTQLEVTPFF